MDRISNLPDEIIRHIGSSLSAKEAAFASVLSKRWRNLFTIIQELRFSGWADSDRERFKDFVDGVLALPISSRVRTFYLNCKCVAVAQDNEQINRCLCDVVKHGVLVLKLEIRFDYVENHYSLPFQVFTCKTVAKMELGSGFGIDLLPEDASLPALKTLSLESVRFYGCAFETLLSASPVLEELAMVDIELERWKWSCTVSSPTLRRLTIRRGEWFCEDSSNQLDCRGLTYDFDSMSFDTPGLTYLEYSDFVPKDFLIVNLDSLVEAELDLHVDENGFWSDEHADDFDPMNLINGFKNVEILDLTFHTMDMFHVFREAIPVFEKLSQVTVRFSTFCWSSLPILIKKSPNLKTLIIESLHYGERGDDYLCGCVSEYSFLLPCPVEVLKIEYYDGSIKELKQMKHFLEKLSCLELVEIDAHVSTDKEPQLMADLQILPKASPKCKIQIKFPSYPCLSQS